MLTWLFSPLELYRHNDYLLPPSLLPRFSSAALFHFVYKYKVAITLRDSDLISLLISRGDAHHCIISKLLGGYWSDVAAVSLSSWAPVCGPHSLLSSASSSSVCPSFASPAFCSTTFMETL